MRILSTIALAGSLSLFSHPGWTDSAYRLDPGAELGNGNLKVEPRVTGPAGKTVRYEITVRREGKSGSSNSSQSGRARLDSGETKLASTSVSVQPGEHYEVIVKLYEGERLVAQQSVAHP